MHFECPNCSQRMEADDAMGGAEVPCPSCGLVFNAPSMSERSHMANHESPEPKSPTESGKKRPVAVIEERINSIADKIPMPAMSRAYWEEHSFARWAFCGVFMIELAAIIGLFAIGFTGSPMVGAVVMFFSLIGEMVAFVLVYRQSEASFRRERESSLGGIALSSLGGLNAFLAVAMLRGCIAIGGMNAPGTIDGGVVSGNGDQVLVFGRHFKIGTTAKIGVTSTGEGVRITVNPNERQLTMGWRGYMRGWNMESGESLAPAGFGTITATGFGNGAPIPLAVAGYEDGLIHVWDTRDGVVAASFSQGKKVSGVALMDEGRIVVGTVNSTATDIRAGGVTMWNARTREKIQKTSLRGYVTSVASNSDGRLLAVASRDATTAGPMPPGFMKDVDPKATSNQVPGGQVIVHVRTWEFQRETPPNSAGNVNFRGEVVGSVRCMAFSPDGERLLVGCRSGHVYLYKLDNGKMVPMAETRNDVGIESVVFAGDGQRVAAGTEKGRILVYDSGLERSIQSISVSSSPVVLLATTGNASELVYAAGKSVKTLRID